MSQDLLQYTVNFSCLFLWKSGYVTSNGIHNATWRIFPEIDKKTADAETYNIWKQQHNSFLMSDYLSKFARKYVKLNFRKWKVSAGQGPALFLSY